jgi:hypothetical protein
MWTRTKPPRILAADKARSAALATRSRLRADAARKHQPAAYIERLVPFPFVLLLPQKSGSLLRHD